VARGGMPVRGARGNAGVPVPVGGGALRRHYYLSCGIMAFVLTWWRKTAVEHSA